MEKGSNIVEIDKELVSNTENIRNLIYTIKCRSNNINFWKKQLIKTRHTKI